MIDLQKDITLVLGIDAKTIEQLEISWPTWRKNRGAMWEWPWLIFYDHSQLEPMRIVKLAEKMGRITDTMLVPWTPLRQLVRYDSQREKMLTGHVYVPAMHCRTKYHMKLDTDALAKPHENWIEAEWFEGDPRYVAPRWHYTKGVGYLKALDDWGDKALPEMPRLNIPQKPEQLRVGHSRMCSWCSYYLTEFTASTANCFRQTCGEYRLPVPSQDTSIWYVGERLKTIARIVGMKSRGWSNHSRINELRRVAAEIMGEANAPTSPA